MSNQENPEINNLNSSLDEIQTNAGATEKTIDMVKDIGLTKDAIAINVREALGEDNMPLNTQSLTSDEPAKLSDVSLTSEEGFSPEVNYIIEKFKAAPQSLISDLITLTTIMSIIENEEHYLDLRAGEFYDANQKEKEQIDELNELRDKNKFRENELER
jgi:hypothetical protein